MKRLLAALCAALLLISLTACGGKEEPSEDLSAELSQTTPEAGLSTEPEPDTEPEQLPEPETDAESQEQAFDPADTAYGQGNYIIQVNDVDAHVYDTFIFEDGELTYHEYASEETGKGSYSYLGLDLPTEQSPYFGMVPEQVMQELDARGLEYSIDVYSGGSQRP